MTNLIFATKRQTLIVSFTLLFISFISPLFISTNAAAEIMEVELNDQNNINRYQALIEELRCLVCQNQNLADSDADLAKDLRRKTIEMINAGKTDQNIKDYMSERYGDFVLYKPPFNSTTALLWIGPFILLALSFIFVYGFIRKQKNQKSLSNDMHDNAIKSQIESLLSDTSEPK